MNRGVVTDNIGVKQFVYIGFDSSLTNVQVISTGSDTPFGPVFTPKCLIPVHIKNVFFVQHLKSFSIKISKFQAPHLPSVCVTIT